MSLLTIAKVNTEESQLCLLTINAILFRATFPEGFSAFLVQAFVAVHIELFASHISIFFTHFAAYLIICEIDSTENEK